MKIKLFTKILVTLSLICFWNSGIAQSVTINPASSTSLIDAKSTNKGILPPRMTLSQRNGIPLSVGLEVYCTDCNPAGPYSYNGSSWMAMFQTAIVSPITYTIGQVAQGGKVFWIDPSGQHGLVVTLADQAASSPWYNGYTNTKAVRTGVYGGEFNTNQILNSFGYGTFAALIAANYTDGVYGDWYLPSLGELVKLVNSGLGVLSGYYWSSTEVAVAGGLIADHALALDGTGLTLNDLKNVQHKVRAIRKF